MAASPAALPAARSPSSRVGRRRTPPAISVPPITETSTPTVLTSQRSVFGPVTAWKLRMSTSAHTPVSLAPAGEERAGDAARPGSSGAVDDRDPARRHATRAAVLDAGEAHVDRLAPRVLDELEMVRARLLAERDAVEDAKRFPCGPR